MTENIQTHEICTTYYWIKMGQGKYVKGNYIILKKIVGKWKQNIPNPLGYNEGSPKS